MTSRKITISLIFCAGAAIASNAGLAAGGHGGGGHGGGGHGGGHHGGGHHGHGGSSVGVYFGGAWFGPGYYYGYLYYYGYPYYGAPYYYPSAVAAGPQSYVEQAPAQQSQGVWYYCSSAGGYYPYVKQCPETWQQVPAQPPS